jgi:hypothetical protein
VYRLAARPPSQNLTGPLPGGEPAVLKGRCGGTDAFLGRGALVLRSRTPRKGKTADPWRSVWCSLRADTYARKSSAAVVRSAVHPVPVLTTPEEEKLPPFGVPTLTAESIGVFGGLHALGLDPRHESRNQNIYKINL